MKRLITLKSKVPNFESEINQLIKEEIYRVLDILYLDWDKMDRSLLWPCSFRKKRSFCARIV